MRHKCIIFPDYADTDARHRYSFDYLPKYTSCYKRIVN